MARSKDKSVKLPDAGGWQDAIAVPAAIAGAILTTAGFLMAFLWAAPVNGAAVNGFEMIGDTVVTHQQLISQKIFYFHMPAAIVSFFSLAMAAFYGIRFLMTHEQRFDTCSRALMEIALLFVIMTMITGDLWTRFEWGVWWTWEPRLTTYLILMLIVIAYFVLRNAVDEPEKRATFASVVSIIALVDVPICFMVTRMIPSSVHPVVLREGGMSFDMGVTVLVVLIGMLCLGHALYRLRFRSLRLRERLEALKEILDERPMDNPFSGGLPAAVSPVAVHEARETGPKTVLRPNGEPRPNKGKIRSEYPTCLLR
ncbi:MAG: cytochrome C assembly protein [Eggerthellaceae bacterium]|nr:cytochrome C assembly protein [Eggerthellaceae bacterium]